MDRLIGEEKERKDCSAIQKLLQHWTLTIRQTVAEATYENDRAQIYNEISRIAEKVAYNNPERRCIILKDDCGEAIGLVE